jgi:uncharacterized protein YceK
MRRLTVFAAATLLLAGCGSQSAKKQAGDLGSVAAEGALVAHDASEGSTTNNFTRVHGRALRDLAKKVQDKPASPPVGRLATSIVGDLDQLADHPGDEGRAAQIERRLTRAAKKASDLEKLA